MYRLKVSPSFDCKDSSHFLVTETEKGFDFDLKLKKFGETVSENFIAFFEIIQRRNERKQGSQIFFFSIFYLLIYLSK